MKSRGTALIVLSWGLLSALAGTIRGQDADGPVYNGKPLSVWADQVLALNHLRNVVDTNHPEVRAMRAIGTNAIPWLLAEFRHRPPQTDQEQPPAWLGLPVGSEGQYHPLRARAGFWALGEAGKPAIPSLVSLFDKQPSLAPSALAGIGAPALPALEHCLTNVPPDKVDGARAEIVHSALGGLYVVIDVGRISRADAAYLLPTIRSWTTNSKTKYWAHGVLEKFEFRN